MVARRLRIVYRQLDKLHDHPDNVKEHDLAELRRSYDRFGFAEPIVVDGRTDLLVAGHGRVDVLRDMEANGEDPPDGITLDDKGRYLAPISTGWSSKDDTEALAFLIAANQTTIAGGWKSGGLAEILPRINAAPLGLSGTGFTGADLLKLGGSTFGLGGAPLPEDKYEEQYGVIVVCENEEAQQAVYERLTEEGMNCRVVVT